MKKHSKDIEELIARKRYENLNSDYVISILAAIKALEFEDEKGNERDELYRDIKELLKLSLAVTNKKKMKKLCSVNESITLFNEYIELINEKHHNIKVLLFDFSILLIIPVSK